MKWVKRGLWIAAWGCWGWLGFGLAHQLPRSLGTPIAKLPGEKEAMALGFVGASNTYAVQASKSRKAGTEIILLDPETGREIGERRLPLMKRTFMDANTPAFEHFRATLRRGVLFDVGLERVPNERVPSRDGLQAIDVETGEWQQLSTSPVVYYVPHSENTLVVVIEGKSAAEAEAAAVFDWRTGKELFRRPIPEEARVSDRPFFVPSRNAVVIPLLYPPKPGETKRQGKLTVYSLANPPAFEETVDGPASMDGGLKFSVSPSGRLFWDSQVYWADAWGMSDVYDFNSKRLYSSVPLAERRPDGKRRWAFSIAQPTISRNGRSIFRYSSDQVLATILDIDTGGIVWRAGPHETATPMSSQEGLIVEEAWHELWKKWLPNFKYETVAWRNVDDGEVVCRTVAQTVVDPKSCNLDRTLFVSKDGSVYRMPLSVNWILLAYCLAILATPLVLLWAVLRFRKRRAARRQTAAALESQVTT
jgi:hypothetical protein